MDDVLSFMLPNQVWALSTHLAIAGGGQPIYTVVQGNQIWYMKSPKGYPWDMNTFDDKYVYQSITEVNWQEPHTFKMFQSKSWPNANGGVAWAPRDGAFSGGLVTADSSYRLYSDCANYKVQDLGAGILTEIVGIDSFDFGGDLGKQFTLTQYYRWGKNYANLEINRYALGFGWAQWELWALNGGVYTQKQVSAFNTFVDGGSPPVVFPCGVPKIT